MQQSLMSAASFRGNVEVNRAKSLEGAAPMQYARRPMATKTPARWSILVVHAKAVWLGDLEAASEAEAIAKGAEEFKQPKERLMAVRR